MTSQFMIWHLIKYWASFFIPAFYKRIQGKNLRNLNVRGPVIIAMNHPNAFTDPIAITYVSYPLRVHYMARGDAFRPGLIAWLLEQIGLVPIFRLQDAGKEGLFKNDDSYRRVNSLLANNAKLIVFAEGICIQERRLRPLKKGVARMVFGAYSHLNNPDLRVVPVGVNYSQPYKFRSDVFYNVGEPIFVRDFIASWNENPARAQKQFLSALEPAMKKLITHINRPEDDEAVYSAEKLCKHDWMLRRGHTPGDLAQEFEIVTELTEKVNAAAVNKPDLLAQFKAGSAGYFSRLKQFRLSDRVIWRDKYHRNTWPRFFGQCLLLVAGSPFYITGLAGNLLPLALTGALTKKLVKTREFFSSFALGFAMVIFPLTYLIWFFVIYYFSPNVLWPFAVCAILAVCGGFCLWYHPYLVRAVVLARALRNPGLTRELRQEREKLISIINNF